MSQEELGLLATSPKNLKLKREVGDREREREREITVGYKRRREAKEKLKT
jgi:hypothetical protein